MQRTVLLSILSVRPSVTRVDCDKTKWRTADILIPHERVITLLLWNQQWLLGNAPSIYNLQFKVTHPFDKRRLRQISAYTVSTVRDSEKNQLWQIGNRSRTYQRAIDGVRALPLSPQWVTEKPIFKFFGTKFNFNRIKSATKFRCVKTSSGKVVEQSISYKTTKNIGRKVFPSTWNIGLNWLTDLLRCCTLSRPWSRQRTLLPNDVMFETECGQLHSERFGRRHNTLQSHGVFALAKHLLYQLTDAWYRQGVVTTLDCVSMATKYTPPCCRSCYAWYLKQNRCSKYTNEQTYDRLALLDSEHRRTALMLLMIRCPTTWSRQDWP